MKVCDRTVSVYVFYQRVFAKTVGCFLEMGKYQNDMYKYRYFGFSDVDCDIESKLSVGKHLAYSQYHN